MDGPASVLGSERRGRSGSQPQEAKQPLVDAEVYAPSIQVTEPSGSPSAPETRFGETWKRVLEKSQA